MATAIRVGQGFDIHRFEETPSGRVLVLGGVQFAGERALVGHSDADVIAHAIADALLGAASLGDIGQHFPDTDPKWAGVDSLLLLSHVVELVKRNAFEIGNVDSTIIAQAPKLAPYISAMRESIAHSLSVSVNQVNVKAKTAEKLGPVGEGLAMEAHAVVLLTLN